MRAAALPLLLCFALAGAASPALAGAASPPRSISWWFDVAENTTVDAANAATIAAHRGVFTRVMPYNARVPLDGNVSLWWGHDADVAATARWIQSVFQLRGLLLTSSCFSPPGGFNSPSTLPPLRSSTRKKSLRPR